MKLHIICSKCIIFSLPMDELIEEKSIKETVHNIQIKNTMKLWDNIKVDAYSSGKECLYFVYPQEIQNICIASYAIPYLSEYFTE